MMKDLYSCIRAIFYISVIQEPNALLCQYNFTPCGIFEKMSHLLKFSTKTWNKEN